MRIYAGLDIIFKDLNALTGINFQTSFDENQKDFEASEETRPYTITDARCFVLKASNLLRN